MVIARVVNGALQVLGRLKQRVHLADGLDSNNVLSEEAIERGLACLALFAERLQGFPADNVTIVGTHTLRQAVNAEVFLKRAAKVIPYPIEIIAGQEEARLIFMGVEHTQPEKGRKLVIDIGGGSTELVIGEDFEPLLAESRRMGCVSFAQLFFPGGEISKTTSAARGWRRRRSWKRWPGSTAFKAGSTRWAPRAPSRPPTKCWWRWGKDGLITLDRLEMLAEQVLQFKSFGSLSLPGLSEDRQSVFVPGLAILCGVFDALAIRDLRLSDARCAKACCMKWKAVSATRTSAAAPPKAWPITTTSIASRPNGCWKPPSCSTRSGWRRTPSWRIRSWKRC